MHKSKVFPILLALAAFGMDASSAFAQGRQNRSADSKTAAGRIETKIAFRDELFKGQPVVVLRRPPSNGGDLIILSGPSITPEQLASAALALTIDREENGDQAKKMSVIVVPSSSGVPARETRVTARILTRLRSEPLQTVADVGEARTTTMYLPSSLGRASLKARGRLDLSRGRGGRGSPTL